MSGAFGAENKLPDTLPDQGNGLHLLPAQLSLIPVPWQTHRVPAWGEFSLNKATG